MRSWSSIGTGSPGSGAEYVEAALAAQSRELVVVDPAEVDDYLVWDVTEILKSLCARRYGCRAATNRAASGVAAATEESSTEVGS